MKEIWKDVPGYEGLYQASNLGRIKYLSKKCWNGNSFFMSKERTSNFTNKTFGIRLVKGDKSERILIHRVIYKTFNGEIKKGNVIDHINHNRKDNCPNNLRQCTQSQNIMNSSIKKKGYKGIRWRADRGKWSARLMHNYKTIYLGHFKNKKDAMVAYNNKAKEIFGEFACLNEV